jgi:hypothetical protein
MGISRNFSAAAKPASFAVLALLAVSACHRETPQEQAQRSAHDAALIEQAQHERPPLQPLKPEPVSFAELSRQNVTLPLPHDMPRPQPGEGCTFSVNGTPILSAVPQFGLARIAGRLEILAADSGSDTIKGGLQRKYAGGEHALELIPPGSDGGDWRLLIRDRFDRVAYSASGVLACAAK